MLVSPSLGPLGTYVVEFNQSEAWAA